MVASGVEPFIETEIALLGEAAALNCAAAIAGVAAMRAAPLESRELDAIADALAGVQPVAGRLASTSINGIFVIDDTYNSNPRSIRAALAAAREVADGLGARLVIAMGDMLELGDQSAAAHQEAIRDVMRVASRRIRRRRPRDELRARDRFPRRERGRRFSPRPTVSPPQKYFPDWSGPATCSWSKVRAESRWSESSSASGDADQWSPMLRLSSSQFVPSHLSLSTSTEPLAMLEVGAAPPVHFIAPLDVAHTGPAAIAPVM